MVKKNSKKSKVNDKLTVVGYEEQVQAYCEADVAAKKAGSVLGKYKGLLRDVALKAWKANGGANRKFFLAGKEAGFGLNISVPEPEKVSSRNKLDEEFVKAQADRIKSLETHFGAPFVEKEQKVILTGSLAQWFIDLEKQWADNGTQYDEEECVLEETYRLSEEGARFVNNCRAADSWEHQGQTLKDWAEIFSGTVANPRVTPVLPADVKAELKALKSSSEEE